MRHDRTLIPAADGRETIADALREALGQSGLESWIGAAALSGLIERLIDRVPPGRERE